VKGGWFTSGVEAKRWLNYAASDLAAASTLLEDTDHFPRQVCFLAQQVAEKAIKAVLVFLEVDFPNIHDLDRLRDLIPGDRKIKSEFPDLANLTIWAVESRYPGEMPVVVETEARAALELAKAVLAAARKELQKKV